MNIAGTIMGAGDGQTDEDLFALGVLSAGNVVELEVGLPASSRVRPVVSLLDGAGEVGEAASGPGPGVGGV